MSKVYESPFGENLEIVEKDGKYIISLISKDGKVLKELVSNYSRIDILMTPNSDSSEKVIKFKVYQTERGNFLFACIGVYSQLVF